MPIRLPEKLMRDIDTWAQVYRDPYKGMNRSTAIRCLLLLGLQAAQLRVVDPKDKTTFEGATLPILKFFRRGMVGKWLREGTSKAAKLKPPAMHKASQRARPMTKDEINAIVDRAVARSKKARQ